jgi:hypothetical protein
VKKTIIAVAALAVTAPLLAACNGGRDCDSAPAPRDDLTHTSPASAMDGGTGEAAFEQVAAPGRTSGGRGGGGRGGGYYGGGSGDDCDDD